MKLFALLPLLSFAVANAQMDFDFGGGGSGDAPLMICKQVDGELGLRVESSIEKGLEAVFSNDEIVSGTSEFKDFESIYTFKRGSSNTKDFLSLEIRRVNGREIGVLIRPAKQGPAAFEEVVLICAPIFHGAASSTGG